jgi:hypothetical protein
MNIEIGNNEKEQILENHISEACQMIYSLVIYKRASDLFPENEREKKLSDTFKDQIVEWERKKDFYQEELGKLEKAKEPEQTDKK